MSSAAEGRCPAARPYRRARHGAFAAACVVSTVLLFGTAAAVMPNAPVTPGAPTGSTPPTTDDVLAAVARLKKDPNLERTHKSRTLRWVDSDKPPPPTDTPGWVTWLRGLFRWMAEGSRLLLWVAGGLAAALLAVQLKRWLELRDGRYKAPSFTAPSHVRDLDIRPESLPEAIGGAARELWSRGEHRAALALLYRGLLSRLAHVHGVPIKHSTTEGDCIALAKQHLDEPRRAYVTRLVGVWQRAVYGGLDPQQSDIDALCGEFRSMLDSAGSVATHSPAAPAAPAVSAAQPDTGAQPT